MALAVPHVGGNVTTATGTTTSDSWTSAAGSLIVVVGHVFNSAGAATNGDITDSKSNSYTLVTSLLGGASAPGIGIWYQNGGTRGASHTVTYNPTAGTGESVNIAVVEITGHDTSTPLDSTTFATASDATSPVSVTAAAAISGNQIAIYGATLDCASGNNAWTQPTGYTNIINTGDSVQLVSDAAYKINETGTPTVSASNADPISAGRVIIATFKEATATAFDPPLSVPPMQFNIHRM